jgi:Alpha/beta hydrolase domain/IPT/TIG domain
MRPFARVAAAVVFLVAAIGGISPSHAYVQQIIIDATDTANYNPIPLGSSTPGAAVSYVIYTGRIIGSLSPTNPLDSVITDLNLAPQSGGSVTYTAVFSILTPINPAQRSGLLIHEVPNRGGNAINTNALIQGATYVQSGWQGDLLSQCATAPVPSYPCVDLNSGLYGSQSASYPFFTAPSGLAAFVVQVPVATSDGNPPNGTNTITGQVYGHVCTGTNGCGLAVGSAPTSTAHLQIQGPAFVPYQPASMDTAQAQLWTVSSQTAEGVDSVKTPIPSSQWAWANCPSGWPGTPNPTYICLNGATFDPNLLYEVTYTAANPLVLGVGFAAFRDLASFLRYGTTAPGGGSNPVAGSITKAMTVGASQSAAFLHGLIFYGFNEDEDGRIVFDGAWPQIDGRMMVMNVRWGQPNNLMYLYMGGDEAPVWWADYPNLARDLPADGMLHRCNATGTCPQILETFASAELYSEKMSVALCGFTCAADIPLPANVYRYYTPGATHGGGTASFTWTSPNSISTPTGQSLPNDPIPETYTNNALQSAFIQWLTSGTPMPQSVYPTLARGQLVSTSQVATAFPNIPNVTFGGTQAWPPFVYDFGPGENYDQESGIPSIQPPTIDRVLPVYAAAVNADGNENVDGVPTVLGQAPLGTYVGWNLATTGWYGPNASNGPGSIGQVFAGAGNSGGFWPFWDTKANRLAVGDPRPSLEERYGTAAGYNCVVTNAINTAVAQGFLLPSDATALTTMASGSNVLGPPFSPNSADMALANTLCSSPVVQKVTPNSGPAEGTTAVTITGANFTSVTAVEFGPSPAASFTVTNSGSIAAVAPAGGGSVDVTVTTTAGTSTSGIADRYTYTSSSSGPNVSSVSPAGGPTVGGSTVTITGSGFTGAIDVMFGSAFAPSFTVNSDNSITATVPADVAGTVNVTVSTSAGTSATSAADQFSYGSTRTWVAADTGDDANPCSRDAPCLTFAAALTATLAGGEIDVLTPGDYGPLTITKSISICNGDGVAGALVTATSAIIIQAGTTDAVTLSGLTFGGANASNNGVIVSSAKRVVIDKVVIENFGLAGIDVAPSVGAVAVHITNTTVTNSGSGLLIKPSSGAKGAAVVTNVRLADNVGVGAQIDGTAGGVALGVIVDSAVSENGSSGVVAVSGTGGSALVYLMRDMVDHNAAAGIISNQSAGGAAGVYVGGSQLTGNANGVASASGGALISYGNNDLSGNGSNGSFTGTATLN